MNRNEEQLRWLVWLVLTGLMLYLCWKMLEPFVNILLSAVVQVTVFLPLHQYVLKKLKNPSLSALATIGIILLIVTAPLITVTLTTISQATGMAAVAQDYFTALQAKMATGQFQEFFLKLKPWLNLDPSSGSGPIQRLMENSADFVMKNTMNILGGTIGAIFGGVLVIFTMYYLFRDHEKITQLLPDLLPMERPGGSAPASNSGSSQCQYEWSAGHCANPGDFGRSHVLDSGNPLFPAVGRRHGFPFPHSTLWNLPHLVSGGFDPFG